MNPTNMKQYVLLAFGGLLIACAQVATAAAPVEKKEECMDLQCLICPGLSSPAEYAEGNMKLLKEIVPGRDRWLFRS